MQGILWIVGGAIATWVGYSAARGSGGIYFVFWGAIIYGLLQVLRGLDGYLRLRGMAPLAPDPVAYVIVCPNCGRQCSSGQGLCGCGRTLSGLAPQAFDPDA
jgi:hypothetical protein